MRTPLRRPIFTLLRKTADNYCALRLATFGRPGLYLVRTGFNACNNDEQLQINYQLKALELHSRQLHVNYSILIT